VVGVDADLGRRFEDLSIGVDACSHVTHREPTARVVT